ncbi:MAG: hypothetical protein ABIB46_06300 [bacterium]
MLKKNAILAFNYYGNNIYSPTGRKSEYNEKMRIAWAKAIDSRFYKKLPNDAIEADKIIREKYKDIFK